MISLHTTVRPQEESFARLVGLGVPIAQAWEKSFGNPDHLSQSQMYSKAHRLKKNYRVAEHIKYQETIMEMCELML